MSSTSSFWCHFCHSIVRISSSSPSLCCPSCGFGFVEQFSNEPGFLLVSRNPAPTDLLSDEDGNIRDVSSRRSSSSGRGFLRRLFRSNRGSRQAPEGRPSLLQVLEIASSVQRSRDVEGGDQGGDDRGSQTSLGFSLLNGDDNELSRLLGARGEDGPSVSGSPMIEGPGLTIQRPNEDIHTPRPLEILLQRFLTGMLQGGPSGSKPASKAAIASMPTFKISKQSLDSDACSDGAEPHQECAVCKEAFEIGGEVKEMPCKHFYHSNCILPWLQLHSSCPLCRQEMPVDEGEQHSTSATSDGTAGVVGGEPTIVFIGVSGTSVLVFSFIVLGAGSRNEMTTSTNVGGEHGNEASHVTSEAGSTSEEMAPETCVGNAGAGAESNERDDFEAGQVISPLGDDSEQGTDQRGALGKRSGDCQAAGYNDGNTHVEERSNGCLRDVTREMSVAQDEPEPSSTSNGLETWSEEQLMSGGQGRSDTRPESRDRSFFSWLFRHTAVRSSAAESSAESSSDCTAARHDDWQGDTP